MPAIIDSAPDCVSSDLGTEESRVEDSADFVMGDPYADCAGFMTFGPGSTYGPEGVGAETAYMVLTWVGIVFMVVVLLVLDGVREPQAGRVRAREARRRRPTSPSPG